MYGKFLVSLKSATDKHFRLHLLAACICLAAPVAGFGQGVPKVSAEDLFKAYIANSVAAESKYRGKPLVVTGKVRTISKLDGGQPTVLLEAGSSALDNVTVFGLSDSEVAALGKGQEITVTCTGGSRIAMSPAMQDCSLR